MTRISAMPALRLREAIVAMAARGRQAWSADAGRRAKRPSGFLRDEGLIRPAPELSEVRLDASVPAFGSQSVELGHDADRALDAASLAADRSVRRGWHLSWAAVAGLGAAATAMVIAGIAWRTDDGTWVASSFLTFFALTVAFFAGRSVLAPASGLAKARSTVVTPETDASPSSAWRQVISALVRPSPTGEVQPMECPAERSAQHRCTSTKIVRKAGTTDGEVERLRRHVRICPRHKAVVVITEQGVRHDAEILDLSQSGVALEGTMPGVWIGSMVTVGSRRAKAVRMLPRGMALEFSVPILERSLHANTVL